MPTYGSRRNSLRLTNIDYAHAGAVFVTIVTHEHQRLFGAVRGGTVALSPPGEDVRDRLLRLPERFPAIELDAFIVMPDHLHAIIVTGTSADQAAPARTVGFVINSFKNQVISAWRTGVQHQGWPRYRGALWHRDYYDRVIRNDRELETTRDYIAGNPARWEQKRRGYE